MNKFIFINILIGSVLILGSCIKKTIAYKYLRSISEFEAYAANNLLKLSGGLSVKPGQKFCYDCFNACNSSQSSVHSEYSEQNRGEVDK